MASTTASKRLKKDFNGAWVRIEHALIVAEVAQSTDTSIPETPQYTEDFKLIQNRMEELMALALELTKSNKYLLDPYKESTTNKRAPNCPLAVSETAVSQFRSLGFERHLRSRHNNKVIPTLFNFLGQFVTYVKDFDKTNLSSSSSTTTIEIFLHVIEKKSNIFHSYSEYLESEKQKPNSIANRLDVLIHAIDFLQVKRLGGDRPMPYADSRDILGVIKRNLTAEDTTRHRDIVSNPDVRIAERRYVPLCQFQDMLIKGWPLFHAIIEAVTTGIILDAAQYLEVRRYVLTAMYGFHNNARARALESLLVTDLDKKDFEADFTLSTDFKTRGKYLRQIVNMSDIIRLYMRARKQIEGSSDCPFVFVTFGSARKLGQGEVSKNISAFTSRFGLHMTSTDCRKMLETAFAEALEKNVITTSGNSTHI